MTDLQAAIGLSQLRGSRPSWRNACACWSNIAGSAALLRLLEIPHDVDSALHLAVIRLDNVSPVHHRQVFDGLRAAGIGVQLHYTPVHLQPYYRRLGFQEGDFPEAEAYATNAISLPLYPGLQDHDLQRVADILTSLLGA